MRALIVFSSFIAIAYASSSSRGASITVYCAAYGDGFWPLSNLGESPNFTIISNYMGQDYYNDTTCTTTLLTGDLPTLIVVLLEHFDVELSDRCTKDWLCVRGIRLCGIWTGAFPFAYTLPANTTFTLKFQSDSAVTRPGFKIKVYTTTRIPSFRSSAPYDFDYDKHQIDYAAHKVDISNYILRNDTHYIDECATDKFDITSPYYFNRDN